MPPVTATTAAASSLVIVLFWQAVELWAHLSSNPALLKQRRPLLEVAYCAVSPDEETTLPPLELLDVDVVLTVTGPTLRVETSEALEVLK